MKIIFSPRYTNDSDGITILFKSHKLSLLFYTFNFRNLFTRWSIIKDMTIVQVNNRLEGRMVQTIVTPLIGIAWGKR